MTDETATAAGSGTGQQHGIIPDLLPLAVPVLNLEGLPGNARNGDVQAVARSFRLFGQRKPLVARQVGTDEDGRRTGIVLAGNHGLVAARDVLGWDSVAVVFTDDDDLTGRAYALADNRTGDLASWHQDLLATELQALSGLDSMDLTDLGWTQAELTAMLTEPDFSQFAEFDESAADGVRKATCPACGEVFPL